MLPLAAACWGWSVAWAGRGLVVVGSWFNSSLPSAIGKVAKPARNAGDNWGLVLAGARPTLYRTGSACTAVIKGRGGLVVVGGWTARIVTHGKGRGWAGGWWFHVRLPGPARETHSTTRTLYRRYQLRYGRRYLGRIIQPLVVVVRSEGLCQEHANQW